MACTDNIVTLRDNCSDPVESLSGYDGLDAPEITPLTLANIATEKYISGMQMARKCLSRAILDVQNDFQAVLAANNVAVNLDNTLYNTGDFQPSQVFPATPLERGITIHKAPYRGRLRKTKIKSVSIYPTISVPSANIYIYDNGFKYTFTVELIANQVNTFNIEHVIADSYARILLDDTNVSVASNVLTCFVGCNGTTPNTCAHVKGFNGTGEISSKEGFGVSATFMCECDYDQLLCDLSKKYTGKIIYTKFRINVLNERIYSNRETHWVIYGQEEAKELKAELMAEYTNDWNTFVASLPNFLKQYNEDCLNCRGISWKTNI